MEEIVKCSFCGKDVIILNPSSKHDKNKKIRCSQCEYKRYLEHKRIALGISGKKNLKEFKWKIGTD